MHTWSIFMCLSRDCPWQQTWHLTWLSVTAQVTTNATTHESQCSVNTCKYSCALFVFMMDPFQLLIVVIQVQTMELIFLFLYFDRFLFLFSILKHKLIILVPLSHLTRDFYSSLRQSWKVRNSLENTFIGFHPSSHF